MLFNSLEYILMFLPAMLLLYFGSARLFWRGGGTSPIPRYILLLGAFYFYIYWSPTFFLLLLLSMLVNFFWGWRLAVRPERKVLLTFGILLNVLPLVFFKYTRFLILNWNAATPDSWNSSWTATGIILPLGISFYTFQQIAFLVDCYRGELKKFVWSDYALFVSFWPQLIAGPIVHHSEMMPQFSRPRNRVFNPTHLYLGVILFVIGLSKKLLIADPLGANVDMFYANTEKLVCLQAWLCTFYYSLQIYFDFSGYCDMASGVALMFNITLPINFNSPYKAVSIQDFWRRWHITLSRWLRDYLYIPLGGNRKGDVRTYGNLFFTFVVGGIWHGAGWTFLFWGLLHGVAIVIHRYWSKHGHSMKPVFGWLITLVFIHFTWIFFRAPDAAALKNILCAMFGMAGEGADMMKFVSKYAANFALGAGVVLLAFPNSFQLIEKLRAHRNSRTWQIGAGVLCALLIFMCIMRSIVRNLPPSPFLYFQF